ncbi:MAG TPA: EAL domain-containing protein [Roseiarcus sp.]|nr:EAL domain-containing protein [Roseiarcus sp.]
MSKELVSAESLLHQAEWRFRLLVEGVREYAIVLLDAKGDVTNWNPGAERITGYKAEEILGKSFARFYTGIDRLLGAPDKALSLAARDGLQEGEGWRLRKGGERFWAKTALHAFRDTSGEILGFAQLMKDLTEQRLVNAKLHQLAYYDTMTGLRNRICLLNDLKSLAEKNGASGLNAVSIVMLDLDGFKEINDSLGHSTGDHVLSQVAKRLSVAARGSGKAYRLGGDEFTLVLPGCDDPLLASNVADRAMRAVEEPLEIDGRRLTVGASAGIAIAPAHGSSVEEVIGSADLALHDAKLSGGRKFSLFAPAMRARVAARQELKLELRRAHMAHEFDIFYQPQIRLRDGAVVGAEALLRWRHPDRGLLTPASFIETLARNPIATDVGVWILHAACETAAAWRAKGLPPIRLAVNLFPDQFHDPDLPAIVADALRQHELPPDALELEITENIALGNEETAKARLRDLRDLGIGLAFDDFGAGYASLKCLTQYPLTRVKIDRSFVDMITDPPASADTAVVLSMITMAHHLGLSVIAEGVENEYQAQFLRDQGCDEAQGFLYAQPLAAEKFVEFMWRAWSQRVGEGRARPTLVA